MRSIKSYLQTWNFNRLIRLIVGLPLIVFAISNQEWTIAVLGGLFALMALLNTGCAGSNACSYSSPRKTRQQLKHDSSLSSSDSNA